MTMAVLSFRLLLAVALSYVVLAVQVAPNSPCSSVCIDSSTLDESDPNSSSTTASNIVCDDGDFTTTSNGTKWKQCMTCLQNSTFVHGDESDQYWFLYNLRYSFDHCVFGFPNGTGSGSNPCETSSACGPLKVALEHGNLSTTSSQFGYCDADGGSVTGQYYDACLECVSADGDTQYIANALVALEAGCQQRPNVTEILGLSGTVFSTAIIDIVDPASLKKSESTGLSTAAIVGIVVGAIVLVLAATAFICIRRRKRRNRALSGIEPRWGKARKTHKRKSSFSFRCRNILASPISPKFFRDELSPVEEDQQQYGSLDAMASSQVSGITGEEQSTERRYYIESNPRTQRYAYESVRSPQYAPTAFQSFAVPQETMEEPDRRFGSMSERRNMSEKASLNIDTTLIPPKPARQSPKQDTFSILKSINDPTPQTLPLRSVSHASADSRITASSPSQAPNGKHKSKTTTMSSQGSGYPSKKSPTTASPLLKQKSGWPSPRQSLGAWFPPPPPPGPPRSSLSPVKYGLKASTSSMRKAKRESGSPVETKQIKMSFPAPPQR
ncbi:hypothetical protein VPNG_05600 [Cytospora leucostoma]|uniref:LPXTG-domain-containing protein n=1 Tax=Cytospora leucostoma TaxID=1230097 RepID=A0A423X7P1_9PEZI|nr:hypothetical protein VPNG_05600 [Cytospora leucostoma]